MSLSFFNAAMDVVHRGNEFNEDYIPSISRRVVRFSQFNQEFNNVLVTDKFLTWLDGVYNLAETMPLPWRPQETK